jgi:hypothetical protein
MDQDTFTRLVQMLRQLHADTSNIAEAVIVPMLFVGVVAGLLVARWIVRGGLSRSTFRFGGLR